MYIQKLHHFCNTSCVDDGPKSGRKFLEINKYGRFINRFPQNIIRSIRLYERIDKKKYVDKKCLFCSVIYIYIYIYIHTHTHIYIYIYIYTAKPEKTYIWHETELLLNQQPVTVPWNLYCFYTHTHTHTHTHIYIYIYIFSHPQTDCFVLSELFSVARRRTLEAGIETRPTLR